MVNHNIHVADHNFLEFTYPHCCCFHRLRKSLKLGQRKHTKTNEGKFLIIIEADWILAYYTLNVDSHIDSR